MRWAVGLLLGATLATLAVLYSRGHAQAGQGEDQAPRLAGRLVEVIYRIDRDEDDDHFAVLTSDDQFTALNKNIKRVEVDVPADARLYEDYLEVKYRSRSRPGVRVIPRESIVTLKVTGEVRTGR